MTARRRRDRETVSAAGRRSHPQLRMHNISATNDALKDSTWLASAPGCIEGSNEETVRVTRCDGQSITIVQLLSGISNSGRKTLSGLVVQRKACHTRRNVEDMRNQAALVVDRNDAVAAHGLAVGWREPQKTQL